MRDDLLAREMARRSALWSLNDPSRAADSTATLLQIWRLDRDYPIGEAACWSAEQLRTMVKSHEYRGRRVVRPAEIPEPWRTRFDCASFGSTIAAGGRYAQDWDRFLIEWEHEEERIKDLIGQE
ncbi:hypothetical protein [Pseudomonas aeruginosa]|uniref:hypothetical protein n=1 Tax=Pseudomonas aeruginosa TaxID=287 RepID=UPI00117EE5CB|nr:hypothetical protein [Pseudomonas aeruginosa]MBG7302182.1 hypothetical protein [Pseudomonas aeruginosa]MDC3947896.1 hypothetical protein [Pseudomonas aeruginosa]HBP6434418.1 hypothetical protein [Pseudomonas aeruginosa]HCU2020936.1 hypothetical protein [Pseudomonas aeruginosa]